jgi:exosortase H (IPTLxxWG-CTERM-specific)
MKSEPGRTAKGNQKRKEKRRAGISIRRFLVTYLVLMAAFFFFTSFKPILKIVDVNGFFTQFVSAASSKILCLLHDQCTSRGSVITLPGLSLNVAAACSGLDAVMMYTVAVLAYPADRKKKMLGILSGFVIIQAANLLRIIALSYIGIYIKSIFEFVHIYIAQGVMIALALGTFFIYLNHANRPETDHN